jgi:hypothetical protein
MDDYPKIGLLKIYSTNILRNRVIRILQPLFSEAVMLNLGGEEWTKCCLMHAIKMFSCSKKPLNLGGFFHDYLKIMFIVIYRKNRIFVFELIVIQFLFVFDAIFYVPYLYHNNKYLTYYQLHIFFIQEKK